jgi:hypothetical protein
MNFRIDRAGVINEIVHALRQRSVVATGAPGAGKSWLLAEIHDRFKADGYRFLILPAESYDVATLDELQRRLGLPTDIVSFLNGLGDRVLLLVDGLDALRTESSSGTFRQLLEQMREGAPKCKVLVSVRTFDLEQSPRLRSLFARGNYKTVHITELNDSELELACMQAPQLRYLLLTARESLRKLLRNPFMLRLALRLLDFGISYESIGQDTSEVQLLARFWNRRIETADLGANKLRLLKSVVDMMSEVKLISISLPSLLPQLSTKELADAFALLQSDEILKEQLDRVAFSHNILFDYAASRLILTRESLFHIIRDDASLAIFLRPSISYFLTSMWIFERDQFWSTFRRIADPQNDFRERQCTLLANVIADNLQDSSDLTPVFDWPRPIKVRSLRAVLRSVTNGGLTTQVKRERWMPVISNCLDAMEPEYVQETVRLIASLSELSSRNEIEKVAHLARRTLNWSWNEAEKEESLADPIALTTLVMGRLLPIVLENYKTAVNESRDMVFRLLSQFGQQNASPKNAFYLAWGIKPIIDTDPDTAEQIVKAIFGYEEHSLERTDIGGGSISRFTSTRKQDYDQAFYALQRQYFYFVEHAPLQALRAALVAVNEQVRREHLEGRTNNDSFEFQYDIVRSRYRADWSEIWDSGHSEMHSLSLLDICLRYLLDDGIDGPLPAKTVLALVAQHNELAVAWRHIFFPLLPDSSEIIEAVIPLVEVPSFLSAPEITRSIGNYIERIYSKQAPSENQRRRIERAILALGEFEPSIFRYEQPTETRDRLLARIPVEDIVTEKGLSLRKSLESREEELDNQPFVRSGFMQGGPMDEEFLEMRGIDTKNPRSKGLLDAIKTIRSFSSSYVNSVPSADDVNAVLDGVRQAWACLRESEQEDDISANAAGVIAASAAAIAKCDEISLDSEALKLSREILLELATHSQPLLQPNADEAFDHPGWGSPSTRIEVAEGLMLFASKFPNDADVIATIRTLAQDPVPAVRFQIAVRLAMLFKTRRDLFAELTRSMIRREKAAGVLGGLIQTINRIGYADPDLAVSLLREVVEAPSFPEKIESFGLDFVVVTLLQLDVFVHNQDAREILMGMMRNAFAQPGALMRIAHNVRLLLELDSISTVDEERALTWLKEIVTNVNRVLDSVDLSNLSNDKSVNLLKTLETVVFQIMILLDVDPNLRNAKTSLSDDERRVQFVRTESILAELVFGRKQTLALTPSCASNLLKIFTKCLAFAPKEILAMLVRSTTAGARFQFHYDQMAIAEFVDFAEVVLSEHRYLLRDETSARQFSDLLDLFVAVGWPQAVQMVTHLDEALR